MNEIIITKAVTEDLPVILDVQRKTFQEVAKTFHVKSLPQIEQTLESLTDEFKRGTFLKACLINTSTIEQGDIITKKANRFFLGPSNLLDSRVRGNDTDDTIVGSVRAHNINDTCYISKLVVLPEYQNKGIGKTMMHEIENQFQNMVNRYELFTGSRDPRNLYLYDQLGYKPFKTEKGQGKTMYIYMEKRLRI